MPATEQGGGGMGTPPTPDYNPSASLLEGGTGVIQAVKGGSMATTDPRGGAQVKFAEDVTEREYSKEAPAKNVSRASRAYTLEIYGIKTVKSPLKLDSDLSSRQRRLLQYVNKEKKTPIVSSATTLPTEEGAFAYTESPKYGDCKPQLPINYFTIMPKKVHFMENRPHTIWCIPNLRGNVEVFETIYEELIDNGKLEKNHVLIFLGAFYPDTPNEASVLLFDEVLKLKQQNPNQVFVLTPKNAPLLRNGCSILDNTYAMKSTLAKQQGKTKEVPTFFEPDVLVFPHEQFVFRVTDMPISADSKVSVGLLLKKKVAEKSYYIKSQPGRKVEPAPMENYVTVTSNPNESETRSWPPKSQQTIKCPKDSNCQEFELGFPLEKMGTSIFMNLLETKLYLFHMTKEKIPFLTGPIAATVVSEEEPEEEEEEPAPEETEEEEEEIVLQPTATITPPPPIKGEFKEDPAAKPSPQSVTMNVEGYSFEVRVPMSTSNSDVVKIDWMNARFTKDEADLLNALQFTPGLLKRAIGENYKWRLANFLANLTLSSCFKETSLLLKSECDDARLFMRKVAEQHQKECLARMYKEWGTPSEGIVETEAQEEKKEEKKTPVPAAVPVSVSVEEELPGEQTFVSFADEDLNSILSGMNNLHLESKPRKNGKELDGYLKRMNDLQIEEDLETVTKEIQDLMKQLKSMSIQS